MTAIIRVRTATGEIVDIPAIKGGDGKTPTKGVDYFDGDGRAMTFYGARLSQDGEVVREYIPCYRKSDGEIGVFETFTQTFLPSQEANGFTHGEEIEWE